MTEYERERSRVLLLASILVLVAILVIATVSFGPKLLEQQAVRYGATVYQPHQPAYCPGDQLTTTYWIERREVGPVEIVSSWCSPANICILPETTVEHAIVFNISEPFSATLRAIIPMSDRFVSDSEWVFVRSVREMGQAEASVLTVPFRIKSSCP